MKRSYVVKAISIADAMDQLEKLELAASDNDDREFTQQEIEQWSNKAQAQLDAAFATA